MLNKNIQLIIENQSSNYIATELFQYIKITIQDEFDRFLRDNPDLQPDASYLIKITLLSIKKGDPTIRSSVLYSSLGFGNARLHLHATLKNYRTNSYEFDKSYKKRHTGIKKGWQNYMENNSNVLLKELAESATLSIAQRIKLKIMNTQHYESIYLRA